MRIVGVQTPLIKSGDDLVEIILDSIREKNDLKIEDKNVLVIASSVISTVSGRTKNIKNVVPGEEAKKLAEETGLKEELVEIILQESDEVLTTFNKCLLTIKDEMLRINAGVDRTNVPPGKVLLLPKNSEKTAKNLRKKFERKTGKKIGIVISDSHVNPLRRGTTGQALGTSGIKETLDCRTQKDLYNRKLQITFRGIGDQIATAAQLAMGEADERIPAVLFKNIEAPFTPEPEKPLKIPPEKCVYSQLFNYKQN